MKAAVLFARSDSIYKEIEGLDVYDIERDARKYRGNLPVIAHPPCRAWGRLSGQAKPRDDEKELAIFAVEQVKRCGGVLEHPANSKLWKAAGLPLPGESLKGGFTLPILQSWFGHEAPKNTWLYISGIEQTKIPAIHFLLGIPPGRVENMSKNKREKTPKDLAFWLVDLVSRI